MTYAYHVEHVHTGDDSLSDHLNRIAQTAVAYRLHSIVPTADSQVWMTIWEAESSADHPREDVSN